MAKPTIVTRTSKGSALSWTEGDSNLTNLRDATISLVADTGGTQVSADLNGSITVVAGTNITISGDNVAKTLTINSTSNNNDINISTIDGNSSDITMYPVLVGNASTGAQTPHIDSGSLFYNASTNVLTASSVTLGSTTGANLQFSNSALSSSAWTTSGIATRQPARTYTDTNSTGTIAASYINAFSAPTLASTNTTTITEAANLYVTDPIAGTNTTLSNKYSILATSIKSGSLTLSGNANFTGNNANITLSPTGAGQVIISPTGSNSLSISPTSTGSMNNVSIGLSTASTGTFTVLTAKGTANNPKLLLDSTAISTNDPTGGMGLRIAASTITNTASTGTIPASTAHTISSPTLASTNAITISEAATLTINAPVAGTNTTISNAYTIKSNGLIQANGFYGNQYITSASGSVYNLGMYDDYLTGYRGASAAQLLTYNAATNVLSLQVSGGGYISAPLNGSVGATTPSSGAFTTITASTSVNLQPSSFVTINPGSTGNINNMNIGATTPRTGKFTDIEATGALWVHSTTGSNGVLIEPSGSIILRSTTSGTIDNMVIGNTTPAQGTFTYLGSKNGFGYFVGSGGTVTQTTSATTAVTLNKMTGQITLFSTARSVQGSSTFSLINSNLEVGDHLVVTHVSGGTLGAYNIAAYSTSVAGQGTIVIRNITTGSLTEAPVLKFTIIKSATA